LAFPFRRLPAPLADAIGNLRDRRLQARHVLDQDDLRPQRGDDPPELRPQPPLVLGPPPLPGDAHRLAGEPAADHVDPLQVRRVDALDRAVEDGLGPPPRDQLARERVLLHDPPEPEPGAFKS
jgi:hypothetical protein